ncbi:galactose-1-phosphate uridylyltransferase [Genlisea aurea]|uniref:Galactose-1-phosphate uridylyltransferase n=1 Tax=Genlisea aurea TaxID=192259 RepID=S8C1H7_9LAMI|nr:galactose-1-phosphate uridylyltransferase [Genlisea aurea]
MESSRRCPEIRKDAVHNRWVIFSPARARRPSDFKSKSGTTTNAETRKECAFCVGHEHECAPEIFRFPPDSSSDWRIRVIQNLYPALSRESEPAITESFGGHTTTAAGFGFHDVVIDSPEHSTHLSDLSPPQVSDVLLAYRKRIQQLRTIDHIQYVQVFKNHGASAGASMSHSHSQIMALPIIPPTVSARIHSMKEHFERSGKCAVCEMCDQERNRDLVVDASVRFVSLVPFAATFPFEIWIIPRSHSSHFHRIDDHEASDLGGLLKRTLTKMSLQLNDPPYNYAIHTAPFVADSSTSPPFAHWFVQIVPQLGVAGGFELGSGCFINPVFPEDAAKILRQVVTDD